MRLLILGGTGFVGPHLARVALDLGHEVTLFHRGRTALPLDLAGRRGLDELRGDRDPRDPSGAGGLGALEGDRRWDACVDLSGYVPRIVGASAELLADRVGTYLFVSSISVYALPIAPGADEDAPVATMDDPTDEEIGADYGALKALCEDRVRAALGERALVVRPGLIVGPGDPTDRFSYWPLAAAEATGRELLCPGTPADLAHVIDARDLARWMVELCAAGTAGTYNASGPTQAFTMGELVDGCLAGTGSAATPVWVPAGFLAEHEVLPWVHMPGWIPPDHEAAGMCSVSLDRAFAAGLACRPLADTARDTLDWLREDRKAREDPTLRAGIPPERAAELLEAWRARA